MSACLRLTYVGGTDNFDCRDLFRWTAPRSDGPRIVMTVPSPREILDQATERAGVAIRTVSDIDELVEIDDLLSRLWDSPDALPVHILKALAHSHQYIAGAWRGKHLVGAAVLNRVRDAGSAIMQR